MRLFKKRSLCLWVICPETGGVKKFRLSLFCIAVFAFLISFGIGALFGVAIDYRRLNFIKERVFVSFEQSKADRDELNAQKMNLEAALENVQSDNSRFRSYELELRSRLSKLESTIKKALLLQGPENNKANTGKATLKPGIGGAEIPCAPNRYDYSKCYRALSANIGIKDHISVPSSYSPSRTDLLKRIEEYNAFLKHIPMGPPLLGEISSGYGFRKSAFIRGISFHKGTDYTLRQGKFVHSTADGVVVGLEYDRTYGRVVDIDHGHGISTRYAHLARSLVRVGQHVSRGDKIAIGGSSGMSTGPHLHYELRFHGRARNPEKFVRLAYDLAAAFEK